MLDAPAAPACRLALLLLASFPFFLLLSLFFMPRGRRRFPGNFVVKRAEGLITKQGVCRVRGFYPVVWIVDLIELI